MSLYKSKNVKIDKIIKYDGKNVDEIVKNLPSCLKYYTMSGNEIILCDGAVHVVPGDYIINENGRFHVYEANGSLKF